MTEIRVALTSIPPRFGTLAARLAAVLAAGPDAVTLTLPWRYERFPDWDGALPQVPQGVEVQRGPDLGPATKFATVFEDHPQDDILLADDDCEYGRGWVAAFRAGRAAAPDAAIAASVFDTGRLGLASGHLVAQGFAGLLMRPDWLRSAAPPAEDPARWADDLWLSAHLAAAGRPILPCPAARAEVTPRAAPAGLQDAAVAKQSRGALYHSVAKRLAHDLGVWR